MSAHPKMTTPASLLVLGVLGFGGCGGSGSHASDASDDRATLLVDDFEDGDLSSLLGAFWYAYGDQGNGGESTVSLEVDQGALRADYTFDQGALTFDPYVGFGLQVSPLTPWDFGDHEALSYRYRGEQHTVRIETSEVSDYDFHGIAVPASETWRTVTVRFASLAQEGWGEPRPFAPEHAAGLSWQVRGQSGHTGSLSLDDIEVVPSAPRATEPDLSIDPPAPPEDVDPTSTVVSNPLQEKALRTLDRGQNLSDWLEAGRFTDFGQFDQGFVGRLAAAGFRSLRLPIDLDLYVEESEGDALVLSDDLFTVLDAFDEWTAAEGLSLTIDYHQYDRSLDFADRATMDQAVALWALVAEHFAESEREDLYFELLNEPELSSGGTPPTAEQWSSLAEEMIAAIRETDTTHTILFGDVMWYDIDRLVERTPFDDPNVIYVFHFYEPFLFTHQGAAWAEMASTHDIPYPYDPERWSEHSSDLGFTELNPSWQLDLLRSYPTDGTRSALRNQMVRAKQWAVDHDVPVICNELGAYDRSSQKEDRARWYADITGIFQELEIPWQLWFPMMDPESGEMDPEYQSALGLDDAR